MKKLSKRQKAIREKVELEKQYSLEEALQLLQEVKATKFDETVDVVLRLGVDPRKADQMVRGTCSLPHGLGKEVRVLVFAKGEKAREAEEAGAAKNNALICIKSFTSKVKTKIVIEIHKKLLVWLYRYCLPPRTFCKTLVPA